MKTRSKIGKSESAKIMYDRNKLEWKKYFHEKYGDVLRCEICGQEVRLMAGNKKNGTVQFDHKRHDLPIRETPANWYTKHKCNEKNKALWDACDFGVLCGACNGNLPTKNRESWILRALSYCLEDVNTKPITDNFDWSINKSYWIRKEKGGNNVTEANLSEAVCKG